MGDIFRQVRAQYNDADITVYQAYSAWALRHAGLSHYDRTVHPDHVAWLATRNAPDLTYAPGRPGTGAVPDAGVLDRQRFLGRRPARRRGRVFVGVIWHAVGMTQIPEENYSLRLADDPRSELPLVGDEREILTSYLDWHRQTFELKCAGVPPERLSEKAVPPSTLSLHGLLRHLAAVERWSFSRQFAGEDLPMLYYSDDDPDQDFETLDGDPAEAFAVWRTECERSREIVARTSSLADTGRHARTGQPMSLRRVLVQMIAEYARHDGHADLLRERIDGAIGY